MAGIYWPTETASQGASTSDSSAPPTEWPADSVLLQTQDLKLARSSPTDASSLWPVLSDPENARLFEATYGHKCESPADLEVVLTNHATNNNVHGGAYTIYQRAIPLLIGWVAINPFKYARDAPIVGTIFLERKRRVDQKTEAFYIICVHAFDTLGHDSIEFYAGIDVHTNPTASGMVNSLLGILRRQTVVTEKHSMSEFADLYRVNRSQWPTIKMAVEAWFLTRGPLS